MHQSLNKAIEAATEKKDLSAGPDEPKIRVNEALSKAAFAYEKLRQAIDYQDEHLFLKNAIKRILKRTTVFRPQDSERIASNLMHELVWARYFDNDYLPSALTEEVASILRKFHFIRQSVKSKESANKVNDIVLGLIACDIETFLSPAEDKKHFLDFSREIISKNIEIGEAEINLQKLSSQIEISIEKLLFKSDLDQIRFSLIKKSYKYWPDINQDEAKEFAVRFDEIVPIVDLEASQVHKSPVFKYIKRNIPPFLVLWDMIKQSKSAATRHLKDEQSLKERASSIVSAKNKNIFGRVARGLVRGIIFILLTKTIFAFLIELPYEARILNDVNYRSLIINICAPPVLMLVTGFFVRIPGRKNTQELVRVLERIVFQNELTAKKLTTLKPARSGSYIIFNAAYTLLSLAILSLVVWGLAALKFSVVSIVLFFFFVSLVSFLAFRIRSTARELEVKAAEEGLVTGVFSFLLLPFVVVGKLLSDKWSQYNFTLFFWDFIIEAPFKTIIGVFESWLLFVREKREDFE